MARTMAIQSRYVRGGTLNSPLRFPPLSLLFLLSSDIVCLDCVQSYHDPITAAIIVLGGLCCAMGHMPTLTGTSFVPPPAPFQTAPGRRLDFELLTNPQPFDPKDFAIGRCRHDQLVSFLL